MARALIVEDDVKDAAHFRSALEADAFECDTATDGKKGLHMLRTGKYTIAVVDIELGDTTGTRLITDARAKGVRTPIIAVSAYGGVKGAVRDLNAGADDYMPKPCDFDELRARVTAILRRYRPRVETQKLSCGDVTLDIDLREVRRGSRSFDLTRLEFLQSRNQRQFIDTGYSISSDHVNGTVVVSNPVTLNGAQEDSGNFIGNIYGPGGFSSGWKKKVFGVWIQNVNGSGGKSQYTAPLNQDQVYTITYDVALTVSGNKKNGKANLTVDTHTAPEKTVNNVSINDEGNTMKLFTNGIAVRNDNTNSIDVQYNDVLFGGRIYSMQLYDNGVLKLDLIPARRESDGELGMYNKVNGEFYTNAGFETFIAGADVGDPFAACGPVGNGYYVGATYTNYGSAPVRNQCPNGSPTMENGAVINDATNIYQCDGVQPCSNAEYPDMSTGVCTSCPTGYDDNTQNGKQSVYECQIYCEAGTYLAHANDATCTNVGNGYYADDSLINWGDAGTRTRCPDGGATNKENAIDVSECETVTNTCSGATYLDSNVCEPCPTGYDANITPGKDNIEQCQIICPAGSYIATANDASCTDAGAGYWAPGGVVNYGSTSTHTQCTTGLTTVGYGHGANEVGDCGRKLHIGNYVLYSKTTKPSEPAINIQPVGGNTVFYVGASDSDQTLTTLHVTQGNTQYTMYDDSILHGERDFETNTRITQ